MSRDFVGGAFVASAALICSAGLVWGQGLVAVGPAVSIPSALQTRVRTSHQTWVEENRTANLRPILTLGSGSPRLDLTVTKNAPAEQVHRTNVAIVSALEYLLADDVFSQVRLSITEFDPKGRPSSIAVKEYDVSRAQFVLAALATARVTTVRDAVRKSRSDTRLVGDLCARLGIK